MPHPSLALRRLLQRYCFLLLEMQMADSLPLIIVVDDELAIAQGLAYFLEDLGFRVRIATSGKQALAAIEQEQPVLVITDYMMPQMNGGELIDAIRSQAARTHQNAPILLLMSAAHHRAMQQATADAWFAKPFNLPEVEELLRRFLPVDERR
ncbi:MAG: response regulator [Ktedonobacterales bacterium]|nr:response regulator [Ktedonobacterales bacterium]